MTTAIDSATEITGLSASALARQIASGALSSREVVEAHLRRTEAVNPHINALVVPLFEQALEQADSADAARSWSVVGRASRRPHYD